MSKQPEWKLIANLGDASADYGDLSYGAFYIYEDVTGVYPPEAEYIIAPDDDHGKWYVYRFILEPCTYINGVLSDNPYHPETSAWFAPSAAEQAARPQDSNLAHLCKSMDTTESEFIALITSADPLARAAAWRMVGEYEGFDNFDEAFTLSRADVDRIYGGVRIGRAVS